MRIISELSGLRRESSGDAIGTYGNAWQVLRKHFDDGVRNETVILWRSGAS